MLNHSTDVSAINKEVLHSWKRIARHLKRSVRTARRWEKYERLPVRRHMHRKSNTVFAYVHELENWLLGRELNDFDLDSFPDEQP